MQKPLKKKQESKIQTTSKKKKKYICTTEYQCITGVQLFPLCTQARMGIWFAHGSIMELTRTNCKIGSRRFHYRIRHNYLHNVTHGNYGI